jgi:hypothetical protein
MSRRQLARDLGKSESTLRRREAGARPQADSIGAQARAAGLKPQTVYARLRRGWTMERALLPLSEG